MAVVIYLMCLGNLRRFIECKKSEVVNPA